MVLIKILSITTLAVSPPVLDAPNLAEEYDYVIIGGGTSGLTVGDRLSEDGKCLWSLFVRFPKIPSLTES